MDQKKNLSLIPDWFMHSLIISKTSANVSNCNITDVAEKKSKNTAYIYLWHYSRKTPLAKQKSR